MATVTRPVSTHAAFPAEAIGKLFAPPEREEPADKLRRLLHEARARKSFLHTAGAYDAFTAAIMTRLGFKALYGSGWQLAATKSMFPDIGVYASHRHGRSWSMRCGWDRGARNTHYFDTEGKGSAGGPSGVRRYGGRFWRPDPDLHPRGRADTGSEPPACIWRIRTPPTGPAATS